MGEPVFSVDVTHHGAALLVAPHGELDLATTPQVREVLAQATSGPVVLDLRGVDFMDTSGIQLLVELRRRRIDFAVVRGPAVERLLDISGMTPHLRMVDTPEDALGDAAD